MATLVIDTPVDNRDIDDAKRLLARAFKRRPREEAHNVVGSVTMAFVFVIMDGLREAGLPVEMARSLLQQTIDQAESQIKERK